MGPIPHKLHATFLITPDAPGTIFFTIRSLIPEDLTFATGQLQISTDDLTFDAGELVEILIARSLNKFYAAIQSFLNEGKKSGHITIQ